MEDKQKNSRTDWGSIDPTELLAAITNVAADLIYLFDLETKSNLYSSRNIADILGYTPEEIKAMGPNLMETIAHPDEFTALAAKLEKIDELKDGEVIVSKHRYINANGKIRCLLAREMVYSRTANGKPKIVLGIMHDVTEQEKQRVELEKLALIAKKATNIILITDRDLNIEWVNESYERLMGYNLAELKGKRPRVLQNNYDENAETLKGMLDSFAKGERFNGELISYSKEGKAIWFRIFGDPVIDENNHLSRYIFVAQDITELKQNEQRLLQSYQRLKNYAFFTSHQLRAPIADILSIFDVFDFQNPTSEDNIRLLHDLKTVSLKLDVAVHELNDIIAADAVAYADEKKKLRTLQNVMLIDDDKVFTNITGLILRRFNKQINLQSYSSVEDALQALQTTDAPPEIIFLDINMPEANGWDFLDRLEGLDVRTEVFMLTSSIDPSDISKSKTYSSVKGYFTKPLTHKVLTDNFTVAS